MDAIDLARSETAPFELTGAHALLGRFAGEYSGPADLWLDPDAPPERTRMDLCAEPVLGGRWLRITYRGVSFGKPHSGEMLLGFHLDAGEFELAWIDSAHTGSAIIVSRGKPEASDAVDVLGSYRGGDQVWGWQTRLTRPTPSELLLEAFNIPPGQAPQRALSWRL